MWANYNQIQNQFQNLFYSSFPNQLPSKVPTLSTCERVMPEDCYSMSNRSNQFSLSAYPMLSHQNCYPTNPMSCNSQRPPLVIPTITPSKPQLSFPANDSIFPINVTNTLENKLKESATPERKKRKYSANNDPDSTEKKKQIRRERNREHAKHSRFRRRCLHEQLELLVKSLQEQNQQLRKCITDNLDEAEARQLLAPFEKTASTSLLASSDEEATKILESPDYPLIKALHIAQRSFVVTDPQFHDNPIVFASQGFLDMTGYSKEEVIGRNCRFLQGPGTDPESINRIRTAIRNGTDCSVCLLNYRKDGSQFWNHFFVSALRDKTNTIVGYVGVQCPVTDKHASVILQRQSSSISTGCNNLLKQKNEIAHNQIKNK